MFAFAAALHLGSSLWLAFGLYTLVGSTTIILLSVARVITNIFMRRGDVLSPADHRVQGDDSDPVNSSNKELTAPIEVPMRILAVDDDPFILEIMPLISAKAGFSELTAVASGGQALELLKSSEISFDCILLDISMPVMDGVELCELVRQMPQYSETPIIMLTAKRDIAVMGDAYRAGATDYVAKPFDIAELSDRLRIAQELILAQRDQVRQTNTEYKLDLAPTYALKLPDKIKVEGIGSLVDFEAFSSYLSQLPAKQVTDIQMFAVVIEAIEAVDMQLSSRFFAPLLQDVAESSAKCFKPDQTVMAYTNNGTLLIAVNSVHPMLAIDIEAKIENAMHANNSKRNADEYIGIAVSVGGPVQLRSAKAERARIAANQLINLADTRVLDKQGRKVAGLFKR
ncbi:PAS:GGDEF protein [Sulfitobacter guttiformis KCTC 32187]|nr:PAS:GGDEF protein [Sulfitobacter guttiformis KCTC 32187]